MTAKKGAWSALLFAWLVLGTDARAQEMYDTSEPSEKEILREAPTPMVIRFLEGIQLKTLRLVGSDGTVWPLEWDTTDDDVFKVEFRVTRPLPPGNYQIEWLAWVRQHYHGDGGVITFTIDPSAATDAGPCVTSAAVPPAGAAPQAAQGLPCPASPAISAPPPDR